VNARIEKFQPGQAEAVSRLIQRNLLEINSRDYPAEFISFLVEQFSPERVVENAQVQHLFVAVADEKVIGTGGLANFGSAETPRYYGVAVFVEPECQGKGIGQQIMAAVEAQAVELGAEKITVRAAIGARRFYEKLGYVFPGGEATQDDKGNYLLEKALPRL
jgi:GNAT superfamily N-acetyltransferase